MLAAMRRNSRNVIIYVLFGVIIAVFVINFGPGSRGCGGEVGTGGRSLGLAFDLAEALSPLAFILPGQLLAEAVSRSAGFDPDAPAGLTKVTRTN